MASSTVGIGLTIGAVAQGSVGTVLSSTRRSLEGLTRSSKALDLAQQRVGRSINAGLTTQQANYDRLGRALGRVKTAHERLTLAAARSNQAVAAGQQSWAKLAGTAMAAWGTVKSVVATAGQAADFADTLRDTRIKGRLSTEQEAALGASIRAGVSTTNQSRGDLAAGAHQLITGGASVGEVQSQIDLMGSTMTALRTSSEETTGAMLALRDMGALDRDAMQGGIERLVAVGQRGQFTPDMMIKAFAQLGDTIKTTGLKGDSAIAELAAGLQIAEGAMGAAGAQAGLQSWLSGLNDPKVAAAYERAGVDYKKSMVELQKSGMSQYQASLELAGAFVRDSLSAQDQQALLAGEDDGRISTMLSEMGLSEVFKDANAARFALSVNNNKDAYQSMTAAGGAGSLDALKALRDESPVEQMKKLRVTMSELAVDIGNALLPSLVSLTQTLVPLVAGVADFIKAHPGVVQAIGSVVAGIVGWRVASVAGVFAFRQVMIVVTQGVKAFQILRSGVDMVRAGFALFRSGTLLARGALLGLTSPIGIVIAAVAGAAYLVVKYWTPIKGFFGRLWGGVKSIFSSTWDGIKSLLSSAWNGIVNLAKSIWEPIQNFFSGLWGEVTTAFDGGIVGIGKLILDWSPLGLFYKVFAGVFDWFGVELPEKFSEFGGQIVEGLVAGIKGMAGSVKDSIVGVADGLVTGITDMAGGAKDSMVGLADNMGGWFKDALGINSPSRVFMELGGGIPEGAAKGIADGSGLVKQAALGMAAATAVTLASPAFATTDGSPVSGAGASRANAALVVHFSPTINVQGAGKDVIEQIRAALGDEYERFKRYTQRLQTEKDRRAYGGIGGA